MGQVHRLRHAIVRVLLEDGLVAHVPRPVDVVGRLEHGFRARIHAGDVLDGPMARHLGHEGFGVEPAGLGEPLEGVAHEGEHALALAPLDPMLERQREDGLDPRRAARDHRDGAGGRDGGDGAIAQGPAVPVDRPTEAREGAALLGEAGRLVMPDPSDEGHQPVGELERGLAVVGDPEGEQQIGPAHDAEPDAPVGLHGRVDLRQGIRVDLDHVVEEAYGQPHHALEIVPVDGRPVTVERFREARDVDGAQIARVPRWEALLTTVVHDEAVGHEAVRQRLLEIEDRLDACGLERLEPARKRLEVRTSAVVRAELLESVLLPAGQEPDLTIEPDDVVASDDEVVIGLRLVRAHTSLPIGKIRLAHRVTLGVEPGRNAEVEEHPLDVLQQRHGNRSEPDRHALGGAPAHMSVRREERLQKPALHILRAREDTPRNSHQLAGRAQAVLLADKAPQPCRLHSDLVTTRHVHGCQVISVSGPRPNHIVDVLGEERGQLPLLVAEEAQDGAPVALEVTIADQPAEHAPFRERSLGAEAALAIHEVEAFTGLEVIGALPPTSRHDLMVRGQSEFVPLLRQQPIHGLHARLEDVGDDRTVAHAESRIERDVDGLPTAREHVGADESLGCINQRVAGDTRIRRLDQRDLGRGIGRTPVDAVEEDHAGIAGAPRRAHDAVEHLARRQPPRREPRTRVDEVVLPARREGVHERVGDGDRDIEVRDAAVELALDELEDVRVVHPENPHVGAAPRAALLDRLSGRVEHAQEGHRARGAPAGRPHEVVLRPQP